MPAIKLVSFPLDGPDVEIDGVRHGVRHQAHLRAEELRKDHPLAECRENWNGSDAIEIWSGPDEPAPPPAAEPAPPEPETVNGAITPPEAVPEG